MKIEQIYTGCLSQAAYYIESNGEAAIIDPLREISPYLDLAQKRKTSIKYIFETHFHADFVSGHIDLAKATGAKIVIGPTEVDLGYVAVKGIDGQIFKIGNISIQLIHTPGHTPESSCYLLKDENGIENALFTGDTLFIGDVGRPDLAQHLIAELTQEKLAGLLYDSLHNKILPLNDNLTIYPAHGAGSACGKNMSKETSDTLGHQKKTNYALQPELPKDDFIKELTNGLLPPPGYFPKNVWMNIHGYDSIQNVLARGSKALTVPEFEFIANESRAIILDTRKPDEFCKGFIPNSINIGIDGNFAVWAGTLIPDINQEILLVAEYGREEEIITRLARVGYDHAIGYLKGGFEAWEKANKEIDTIISITADEFALLVNENSNSSILDVRKPSEYESGHIESSVNAPLDNISEQMSLLDDNQTTYVHCGGGYRSMIFASILRARGYRNIIDIAGGFSAIKKSGKFKITLN
jgi:glyoxylase-like metal-dependent hydrolase (beta-lactamase superfamily II)/rhodanese-related sulfurtransferase